MLLGILKELRKRITPGKKEVLQRFFKTGPGEYGAGDVFLGVMVPQIREVVAIYWDKINLKDVEKLLKSKVHEERLLGLLILVKRYKHANINEKEKIVRFYLANLKAVNNWDLVDLTAHKILGDYLIDKDRQILYDLVKSQNLWERRIGVISCFAFLKNRDFEDLVKLAEELLEDKEDLMHKAVGWALREMGKIDEKVLLRFLDKHSKKMPRTMLRYSLEKLDDVKRKYYMQRE